MGRIACVADYRFAASKVYLMLHAQQHGGQDSCGIGIEGLPDRLAVTRGMGLVTEVFPEEKVSRILPGNRAIGQVRSSTKGSGGLENAPPFERTTSFGVLKLVYDGHVVNYTALRSFLEHKGLSFNGRSSGELLLQLIAYKVERNGRNFLQAIKYVMKKVKGAFSVILMTPDG